MKCCNSQNSDEEIVMESCTWQDILSLHAQICVYQTDKCPVPNTAFYSLSQKKKYARCFVFWVIIVVSCVPCGFVVVVMSDINLNSSWLLYIHQDCSRSCLILTSICHCCFIFLRIVAADCTGIHEIILNGTSQIERMSTTMKFTNGEIFDGIICITLTLAYYTQNQI